MMDWMDVKGQDKQAQEERIVSGKAIRYFGT